MRNSPRVGACRADSTLSYLAMTETPGARAGMRIVQAAFEPSCPVDAPLQLEPGDAVLAVASTGQIAKVLGVRRGKPLL